jgi:hypothetical protein
LLEQSESGRDFGRFLEKLASLTRLALSAAAQKRAFLHCHHPALFEDHRFAEARFVIVPVGLDAVVHAVSGRGLCEGERGLELGRQIIARLKAVLQHDGESNHVRCCLDSAVQFGVHDASDDICMSLAPTGRENAAGLTAWDAEADMRRQLQAAGVLHAVANGGTAAALVPRSKSLPVEDFADLLQYAWHHTEVVRLRLVRTGTQPRQMTATWAMNA